MSQERTDFLLQPHGMAEPIMMTMLVLEHMLWSLIQRLFIP